MARYVQIVLILSLVAIPTGVTGQSPSGGDVDGDGAGIEIIRDLPYARYGDRVLLLDLFRPTEPPAAPRPAIVLIRGGSWRRTDKENFGRGGVELARRGLIAVSIEHRSLSEALFPGAVHDVKAALRWLRAEAETYGINPDYLGTMGHSSGAHLALLTAFTPGIEALEGKGGHAAYSATVQAVVGLGSPTMFLLHPELVPAQQFFGGTLDEKPDVWRTGSPLLHVSKESPPALLMYGAEDGVVPFEQSLLLLEAYGEVGAEIEFVQLAGAPHSFWNRDEWIEYTMDRAAQFFHRHLGGVNRDHGEASWQGAWKWVHPSYDGRLLLVDRWFCALFGAKDRPLPEPGDLTERDAAELFRSMPGPMCGSVTTSSTEEQPLVLETITMFAAHPRNRGARSTRPTRVEGSRMYGDLLRADGSVAVTWDYDRLDQPGTGPFAGAWELDSKTWVGLLVMTDSQYRYVIELRERTSFEDSSDTLTDEQAAYLYASHDAQGGRFSVSGNRMTRVPDVAKDPRLRGKDIVGSFRLDRTSLTTEFGGIRLSWRRVGEASHR